MTMTTVNPFTPQAGLGNTRTYSDSRDTGTDFSAVISKAAGKNETKDPKADPAKQTNTANDGSRKTENTQDQNKAPEKTGEKPVENGKEKVSAEKKPETKEASAKDPKADETAQLQEGGALEERIEEISTALATFTEAIVNLVAEVTSQEPEQIENILQELSLNTEDLFAEEGLTKLVTAISGEEEGTALLTNDELYQQVQDVLAGAKDLMADTAEELDTVPEMLGKLTEEFAKVLERGEKQGAEPVREVLQDVRTERADLQTASDRPAEQTENLQDKQIEAPTASNQKQEQNTNGSETEEKDTAREFRTERAPEQAAGEAKADPFFQTVDQAQEAKVMAVEAGQTTAAATQAGRIMEQILDYMRIQAKPEMTELEMQLNPENLGTLHLTLTSKEGIMTAQFTTQNQEVQSVLQSQLMILRENLEAQGLKVEAVEVTVAEYSQEGREAFGQNAEENGGQENLGGRRGRRIRNIDLNLLTEDPDQMEELNEEDRLTAEVMKANGQTVDYTA